VRRSGAASISAKRPLRQSRSELAHDLDDEIDVRLGRPPSDARTSSSMATSARSPFSGNVAPSDIAASSALRRAGITCSRSKIGSDMLRIYSVIVQDKCEGTRTTRSGEAIARADAQVQGDIQAGWASPVGIGEARARGKVMSAGHSLRRQNYSFPSMTPPTPHTASASEMHRMRVVLAVVIALVLNFATVASISMLITGR
jgi:hypothetical protein